MIHIYVLINPINNHVFYVGATKHLKNRYCCHIRNSNGNNYRSRQIRIILKAGLKPEILSVDKFKESEVSFFEEFYMDLFKSFGFKLYQAKTSSYSLTYENKIKNNTQPIVKKGINLY